jgi:hypothetical protein
MCSKCFVAHYQTAPLAVASTGSPIGSPKSLSKRANSAHPEHGQRLAGYVGFRYVTEIDIADFMFPELRRFGYKFLHM